METEEVIKLVDGIYKNILEKFNPGARQLISAGKAYLKALHGAASASRIFNEALVKIAANAQQGGTTDIGTALLSIVGVYKEIQDQHMNILKAYFVDFLNPLESNLERDIKVVQFEQKKFLQQHKIRADSYSKAAATMKKHRKKKNNAEKEIKSMQALDEEKNKLNTFCEYSLKNAMTQERRRYGFVLERQCSIAKHWMAYHTSGLSAIEGNMENWTDVASTREFLHENMFVHQIRDHEEESDHGSIVSQLRKTRSIDASCLDMRSLADVGNGSMHMQMPRAKSEYNLTTSPQEPSNWDRPVVKALYAYLSSGENQLSFLEDDKLALVGDRAKGWQFGENLRTQKFGWFPVAYVEYEAMDSDEMWPKMTVDQENCDDFQNDDLNDSNNTLTSKKNPDYQDDKSPTRMFGDTIQYRNSKQMNRETRTDKLPKPGLPPTLPAPVVPAYNKAISSSQSFSSANEQRMPENIRKPGAATINFSKPSVTNQNPSRNGIANASLHNCVYSSNDSGFSNEQPPPQPEVDYSDEDTGARVPIRSTRSEKNLSTSVMMDDRNDDNDEVYGTLAKRPLPPHLRQANSFGNLADDVNTIDFQYLKDKDNVKSVKRNKSFWKFNSSKDDNIFQFAMWKHKDLVETPSERIELEEKEATLKRNMKNKSKKVLEGRSQYANSDTDTIKRTRPHSIAVSAEINHNLSQKNFQLTKSNIDKRISGLSKDSAEYQKGGKGNSQVNTSRTNTLVKSTDGQNSKLMERPDYYDEDLYDETPLRRNDTQPKSLSNSGQPKYSAQKVYSEKVEAIQGNYDDFSLQDTNFYDEDDEQDMKAVKRKEILKQYYSSGTDTERNSSSSDPYDCILVEDHLVRNNLKNGRESHNNPAKLNSKRSNRNDDEKLEFSTFRAQKNAKNGKSGEMTETLLPRTKLSKTNSTGPIMDAVLKFETEQVTREEGGNKKKSISKSTKSSGHKSSNRIVEHQNSQSYGPWYDLWANDSIISGK